MAQVPVSVPRLVVPDERDADTLYLTLTEWAGEQGLTLYPHQDEALIELLGGSNVVLATPTGSGKSLVATGAHLAALADGRVSFYTAPIKALVSEKFFALCEVFGADDVGMLTGDASVNADAPIIACTAEVLANIALREGARADVGLVVMDEFHYYGEPDRGWAWQVPLLELPDAQFVLMSATLGDVSEIAADLTRRTGRATAVVDEAERPVPLSFRWSVEHLDETVEELVTTGQAPAYVVHFTQANAVEHATRLLGVGGLAKIDRQHKDAIAEKIGAFRFGAGFGKTLQKLVKAGHRRAPRRDAAQVPAPRGDPRPGRPAHRHLRHRHPRRRHQRADPHGALHRAREVRRQPAAGPEDPRVPPDRRPRGPGRLRHGRVRRGPGARARHREREGEGEVRREEQGAQPRRRSPSPSSRSRPRARWCGASRPSTSWSRASPRSWRSRMRVDNAMLVNVLSRPEDAFAVLRRLLTENHEPRRQQLRLARRALRLTRSLVRSGTVTRLDEPDEHGRRYVLTVDLPEDFALNQPLAHFALAAFDVLDPEAETYALDVVSVVEAVLEAPRQVLMAQQHAARGVAVGEMKADGIEYEERMALLDQITWPQPLLELLEATYAMYRQTHPWLPEDALGPKSVLREMWEQAMGFTDFVRRYELARSEGLVLRYLSDAYRTLRQTVPDAHRSPDLETIIEWLGETIRQTDSSLIDEWEALSHPDEVLAHRGRARAAAAPAVGAGAGAHRHGAQRDVRPGGGLCPRRPRRADAARTRRRRPLRAAPRRADDPVPVGRRRSRTTTASTRRWPPTGTPAGRRTSGWARRRSASRRAPRRVRRPGCGRSGRRWRTPPTTATG